MIVEPKVRGFICTTAHPVGCEESVRRQISYVKLHETEDGPKRVLIIGASTGYGLASRITAAFKCGADTLGIMYEKEAKDNRTATPGYYNTKAFENFAKAEGYYAKTLNGDAFSTEMKELAISTIKEDLGRIDMVIYSLAAPRRTDKNGITYTSVLKTTNGDFKEKSLNLRTNEITEVTLHSASEDEERATIKVMGGEDWLDWIEALAAADVLSDHAITIAYSYIGPVLTYPIYNQGTIGLAKHHLHKTAGEINDRFGKRGITAYISVNKALVTQASAAIPIVPLYISILYRVMKDMGIHENCIEQTERLFRDYLLNDTLILDDESVIRMDDLEMRQDVQDKVNEYWGKINTDTVNDYADTMGYQEDFYHMFGFCYDTVDYSKDVEV